MATVNCHRCGNRQLATGSWCRTEPSIGRGYVWVSVHGWWHRWWCGRVLWRCTICKVVRRQCTGMNGTTLRGRWPGCRKVLLRRGCSQPWRRQAAVSGGRGAPQQAWGGRQTVRRAEMHSLGSHVTRGRRGARTCGRSVGGLLRGRTSPYQPPVCVSPPGGNSADAQGWGPVKRPPRWLTSRGRVNAPSSC